MKSSKDGSKYPKCKESFVNIDYRPTKHPIILSLTNFDFTTCFGQKKVKNTLNRT